MFSVCVLLYGDYPDLAKRCLDSIVRTADWDLIGDIRIGLNDVSSATRAVCSSLLQNLPVTYHVFREPRNKNVWKYPMMHRMFWDVEFSDDTQHIMWFDDDSYIIASDPVWWKKVQTEAHARTLTGSVYRSLEGYRPGQITGIQVQPWYTGVSMLGMPPFVTGGWWVADKQFLAFHDYPFKELKHNNGDVLLGELLRQQKRRPHHFNMGVAINADEMGKESRAKRRGGSTSWPWEGYVPGREINLGHHDFEVDVITFPGTRGC